MSFSLIKIYRNKKGFIILSVILAALIAGFWMIQSEIPKTQFVHTKAHFTPTEFISILDDTLDGTAKELVDQAIEIEGEIVKITERKGRYTAFLKSDVKGRYIQCEMQTDQVPALLQTKTNEKILIKGIYKGILLDAILLHCIIIDHTP